MGNTKRVRVKVPQSLLKEIDSYVQKNGSGGKNDFIREAVKVYLREQKRKEIRKRLKSGYREMSELNLQLADEGIEYDCKLMNYYAESLAESE